MTNGHDSDLEARMQRAERIIAALADIQENTQSELRTLATSQVLMSDAITRMATAQVETTDKLNALIDLMDRHLKDHREDRA